METRVMVLRMCWVWGFPRALPHLQENPAELLISGSQHTTYCKLKQKKSNYIPG